MFNKKYGIILACDVPTLVTAEQLAQLSLEFDEVVGYKVGFNLGLRYGLHQVVQILKQVNPLPVIYDHQKAGTDIPQMGEPFARCCKDAEVNGVIIFAQAGPKTLESFVTSILNYEMIPIVGGVMTHPGYLFSDGGFILDEAPSIIYRKAIELGVTHFVLPGNRPETVKHYANEMFSNSIPKNILMPGIGLQGGDIKQAFEAASGHRSYAIVGSAIYNAPDHKLVLASLVEQVRSYS